MTERICGPVMDEMRLLYSYKNWMQLIAQINTSFSHLFVNADEY